MDNFNNNENNKGGKDEKKTLRFVVLGIICVGLLVSGFFIFKDQIGSAFQNRKQGNQMAENGTEPYDVTDGGKVIDRDTAASDTENEPGVIKTGDHQGSGDADTTSDSGNGSSDSGKSGGSGSGSGKQVPVASSLDDVTGDIPSGFFNNTLFVGDSRTEGLKMYGGMTGATFFSDTGMSVYKLGEATCTYDDIGTVTLEQLLAQKKFTRVYFMMGINEVGYPHDSLMSKYSGWVETIAKAQPNAQICICANLHVGATRNASDDVVNNTQLDDINSKMEQLAKDNSYLYIDCNTVFDDANHCLDSTYSGDGTHPTATYYQKWGVWLANYVAY